MGVASSMLQKTTTVLPGKEPHPLYIRRLGQCADQAVFILKKSERFGSSP